MTQTIPSNPYDLFSQWFEEAKNSEPNDPNAMAIASIDTDGKPSVRIVLMRGYNEGGFRFFTNYESRKGMGLTETPVTEANFYWKSLHKQIRISGDVEKLPAKISDEYYNSRHRSSRIGAWASQQSSTMQNYKELQKRIEHYENKFEGQEHIPRPAHWGGFLIKPDRIEFWQNQEYRLHKRFVYTKINDHNWDIQWLYP